MAKLQFQSPVYLQNSEFIDKITVINWVASSIGRATDS